MHCASENPTITPAVALMLCMAALTVMGCAKKPSPKAKPWPVDANAADSLPAAEKALSAYRKLHGLPDNLGSAKLGQPFDNVWLRLDSLKAAAPDAPLKTIKTAGGARVIYPVLLEGGGTDSIIVQKVDNEWKPAVLGGGFLGPRLAQLRKDNPAAAVKSYALSVPALNAHFLAYEQQGKVWLVPVIEYPQYKLKNGQPVDADLVMPALVAAAQRHGGQPG